MRFHLLLGCLVAFSMPALAASYDELSDEAKLIVAQVKDDGDANEVCKSADSTREAVRLATRELLSEGTLKGRPRAHAVEAGKYLQDNCGSL